VLTKEAIHLVGETELLLQVVSIHLYKHPANNQVSGLDLLTENTIAIRYNSTFHTADNEKHTEIKSENLKAVGDNIKIDF
jgi:hypothetical protein